MKVYLKKLWSTITKICFYFLVDILKKIWQCCEVDKKHWWPQVVAAGQSHSSSPQSHWSEIRVLDTERPPNGSWSRSRRSPTMWIWIHITERKKFQHSIWISLQNRRHIQYYFSMLFRVLMGCEKMGKTLMSMSL